METKNEEKLTLNKINGMMNIVRMIMTAPAVIYIMHNMHNMGHDMMHDMMQIGFYVFLLLVIQTFAPVVTGIGFVVGIALTCEEGEFVEELEVLAARMEELKNEAERKA